jgi:signal transduction histidine kinase
MIRLVAPAKAGTPTMPQPSLAQLTQRLSEIDAELAQLPQFTLRGDTGAVGYRSERHLSADSTEWIRIELGQEIPIDLVVLVPALYRDTIAGIRAEGFPQALRVMAGTTHTTNIVASFSTVDHLLPRIAPLSIPFEPVQASWIAIEANILSRHLKSRFFSLQLSEIMVFSGGENVALQKPVTVPIPAAIKQAPRHERYLTDGFTPYLMDTARGSQGLIRNILVRMPQPPPSLTIDLQTAQPVNQINLHAENRALSIPMVDVRNWAMPRQIRILGANLPDFSDQALLCEYAQRSVYENGPVIMRRFPETQCRYIRIVILDHQPITVADNPSTHFAYSEIEVLSQSQNVALNAPVTASSGLVCRVKTLTQMTDGLNYYGEVLPLRDWITQLARRHDLLIERPLEEEAINARYARQRVNLTRVSWLAALLAAGTIITVLLEKMARQRAIFRTRERIAANLHDELGANLHAIGLLGDLTKQEVIDAGAGKKWATLIKYVNETRALTEETVKTARYCTDMLEANELHQNLVEEMKRTAARLLADLKHEVSFARTDLLQKLTPRRRIGLYLFYKECLTNIIRHARATHVVTRLTASRNGIWLIVRDNGLGLKEIPPSLKRRARLLKAKLSLETPADGGTEIKLRLRMGRKSGTRGTQCKNR